MNFFGLFKRSDPLPATAPVARELTGFVWAALTQ